jgi:hypothetical protein
LLNSFLSGQSARELQALPDYLEISPGRAGTRFCLFLKRTENICRILELDEINRSIRPTGVIGSNLPDRRLKPMEQLGAFVSLADLGLVEREAELLLNRGWKTLQCIQRVDKPHEPPGLLRHNSILCQN